MAELLTNLLFEPKGKHNPQVAYNIKDTVMSADGSQVYFALKAVPVGIQLNNTEYWKLQIDLSGTKAEAEAATAAANAAAANVKGDIARLSEELFDFKAGYIRTSNAFKGATLTRENAFVTIHNGHVAYSIDERFNSYILKVDGTKTYTANTVLRFIIPLKDEQNTLAVSAPIENVRQVDLSQYPDVEYVTFSFNKVNCPVENFILSEGTEASDGTVLPDWFKAAYSDNILYGKKLAVVGDSITEAINPAGGHWDNYGHIIAKRNGMSIYSDGVNGSTMTNVEGRNPFSVDRYLAVPEYDYLLLWFGWNDGAYATLGTIDDEDNTTFYGAYKTVLKHFITTYPTKKIGIIVPYGELTNTQNAVRKVSELYGVPCLDLPNGKECSLLWGKANEVQLARRAALTYDGTHPNPAGYEYISTVIEAFLRRL